MRYKLFLAFILLAKFSFSQPTYSKDQINRIAYAGQVWGYIKYHHPYLQYKKIKWDSAFSATVPGILAARNNQEYQKCIGNLLSILNDPLTTVINRPPPPGSIKIPDLAIKDSLMIITIYDYRAAVDKDIQAIFQNSIKRLNEAKAVIFDLRPDKEIYLHAPVLQDVFDETEILFKLFQGVVNSPAIRTVTLKTFISELPQSNSDYQSPFLITRQNSLSGNGKKDLPIIFIINKHSELPKEALALHSAGKAAIIQEEGGGEIGIAPDVKFYISDSLLARVRTGELIDSYNGLGFIPNLIIPEKGDRNIAIEKGREMLQAGIRPYQFPKKDFSGFTSYYSNHSLTNNIYPEIGQRVLAVAKIYSVLKYFYPNKHLLTLNWDSVYLNFLPRIILAGDSIEYVKTIMEMHAYYQDGHGFIQHPLAREIRGIPLIPPPFNMRIIENQLVITDIIDDSLTNVLGIKKGDIIMEKNGINAIKEIDEKRKYFNASNYDAQSGNIANIFLGSPRGNSVQLKLKDAAEKIRTIQLPLLKPSDKVIQKRREFVTKGNDKAIMYFIKKDIGYVNLGALLPSQVDSMFTMFRDTKAIIFDIRAYPRGGPISSIGARIKTKKPNKNRKERMEPGWEVEDVNDLKPGIFNDMKTKKDFYTGMIVGLIHENTQSHGEVTADWIGLCGTLVGNHTAGANGDRVSFFVPGQIMLSFTGGSTYMQGKGIQPDILITPTIKGIQQGKDEILERAIKFIETGK
jgi:C-terminal processing protease CtpA/Prc